MANTLKFVESVGGADRLALDYIEGGTHIPLPSHTKVWSSNITAHGSKYLTGKYEMIPITLSLKVEGSSKSDLDDDLQAIITEITRENWLYFEPESAAAGIYYHTYPYDAAEAHSFLSKRHRDHYIVHPFNITLMAEPFAYTAETTVTVVSNLAPNWNMEDFTGDDPDDWTVTETAGAGAATVTQDTDSGDYIFGSSAVNLTATADDSVAQIQTTAAIAVTATQHYCIHFNYQCEQGELDALSCVITQFNAAHGDLSDDLTISLTAGAVDTWYSSTTTIHPNGDTAVDFHADCAEVKIAFKVNGTTGGNNEEYQVDGVVFTNAEYLSGNTLSNPLGVVIPSTAISGDVPAPCDIYLSALDTTVDDNNGIYIGGRENYDDDFVPYAAADVGTSASGNMANGGSYKTITIAGDLVVNGGFENITGAAADGNFDDWTETEGTNGTIRASTSSKYGTYAVWSYIADGTTTRTNEIETTAYIAIADDTQAYTFRFWRRLLQYSGYCKLIVKIKEYDAVPALLATHSLTFTANKSSWTQYSYTINGSGGAAPKFNANTTQVKIEFEMSGRYRWPDFDQIFLDGVEFYQSSVDLVLSTAFDLDDIKGYVMPLAHLKVGGAQSSISCALQGKITDGTNDITNLRDVTSSSSQAITTVWAYSDLGLDSFEIPNAMISDGATTTGLDQALELGFTGLTAGGTPLSVDDLVLLPIDNGYAVISPLESKRYIILDSQSEMPGVLQSYDGSITNAAWMSDGEIYDRFYLDPQNGTNIAILEKWLDSSNNEYGQFLMDVSIKYKPRYLLTA